MRQTELQLVRKDDLHRHMVAFLTHSLCPANEDGMARYSFMYIFRFDSGRGGGDGGGGGRGGGCPMVAGMHCVLYTH